MLFRSYPLIIAEHKEGICVLENDEIIAKRCSTPSCKPAILAAVLPTRLCAIYNQHRQFVMSCMDTYNEPCSLLTACLASLGYFACLRCSVFLEASSARIAAICQNVSPCFISFIKVLSCEGECLYALLFKLIQFRHRI